MMQQLTVYRSHNPVIGCEACTEWKSGIIILMVYSTTIIMGFKAGTMSNLRIWWVLTCTSFLIGHVRKFHFLSCDACGVTPCTYMHVVWLMYIHACGVAPCT